MIELLAYLCIKYGRNFMLVSWRLSIRLCRKLKILFGLKDVLGLLLIVRFGGSMRKNKE